MSTQDLLAAAGLVAAGLMAATRIFRLKNRNQPMEDHRASHRPRPDCGAFRENGGRAKSQDQKWEELKHYQEETRRLLDDHVRTDDERNADLLRSRILRFNNELVRGIEHTQEDFDEILCIIDDYRTYCKSHEEYKNNKCAHAIANIERCYDERLEKHDFL